MEGMRNMKQNRVKKMIYAGMLAALAFVLYSLEVSVGFLFPAAPFLKFEFSDVPAFVATLGFGPVMGILVEFIKNVLHIFITKEPAFSGEIGNFLAGLGMILPAYFVLKTKQSVMRKIAAAAVSAVATAIVMAFVNFFITLPLYGIADFAAKINMILAAFIPFNLLKAVVVALISFLLYDILKKYHVFGTKE